MKRACLLCVVCLSLIGSGCDAKQGSGQGSQSPRASGTEDGGCTSDPAAWVTRQREAAASSDASGQQSLLAGLGEVCEAGSCAAACVELGRRSLTYEGARAAFELACIANDELGCALAGDPNAELSKQLCEAGEWLACAASITAEGGAPGWQTLSERAAASCASGEQRACLVAAWSSCAGLASCDERALAWARQAQASPSADATAAIVACHAGDEAQAMELLGAACEAGNEDNCGRRCETLHGNPLLVLEAQGERSERAALLLALSGDAEPSWYPVVSAMDADTLDAFVGLLEKFTPPVTEVGAAAKIPAGLREQFPVLVEALMRAPNVDKKKIKYWFGRLPDMNEEQRKNLRESLLRQSWMIAGDPSQTPYAFIERERRLHGGMSPAWGG